jgi:hypothetical protein
LQCLNGAYLSEVSGELARLLLDRTEDMPQHSPSVAREVSTDERLRALLTRVGQRDTKDTDVVRGGGGRDKINVADGDERDRAKGGAGRDWCIVDARKEVGPSCFRVTVR